MVVDKVDCAVLDGDRADLDITLLGYRRLGSGFGLGRGRG